MFGVFQNAIDGILNIGTKQHDDIQMVRLIRQVNGLNGFYTIVAMSVGILLYLFVPGAEKLAIVQFLAMALYFFGLLLTGMGRLGMARKMVIYVFEWHLFLAMLLTNAWDSSAIFIVVLYPLLAALVEESIFRHMLISLIQAVILIALYYFFPKANQSVLLFSSLDAQASQVLRMMSVAYIPTMAAVVIGIIFSENMRAREKQKKMLNEISIAHKQLEYYAAQLEDETQRLRVEVAVARKIQTMVLPSEDDIRGISDLDISCIMRPADEVGGDYYDLIELGGQVFIGIGDVTGHGLSSGIIMMMAQTAIRTVAEFQPQTPAEFISILNRVLFSNIARIKEDRNMTLSILYYRGKGNYMLSGQHESIIICRNNGQVEDVSTLEFGYYVGMLPDIADNMKNYEFRLEPGETLILYSDGVTEAENSDKEQFGMDRFLGMAAKYRSLPAESIKNKMMKDLYNYIGETIIYDDITLVVIKQK